MTIATYSKGQTIELDEELRDDTDQLVAATSVTLTLRNPSGATTTPTPANPSTGVYVGKATLDAIGLWSYRWDFVLAGDHAVRTGSFYVAASPFEPNPIDLTDLGSVRAFLQKPDGDTNQDAVIGLLITAASREIRRVFEREFSDPQNDLTRNFRVHVDEPFLSLAPYDLRDLTTLTLDPHGTPVPLTRYTDFDLLPTPNPDGVFTSVRFYAQLRSGSLPVRHVAITGDWGFAAVPAEVTHWANVTVAEWLRRDVSAFSSVFNIDTQQLERPAALPAAVIAGLSHFRRGS